MEAGEADRILELLQDTRGDVNTRRELRSLLLARSPSTLLDALTPRVEHPGLEVRSLRRHDLHVGPTDMTREPADISRVVVVSHHCAPSPLEARCFPNPDERERGWREPLSTQDFVRAVLYTLERTSEPDVAQRSAALRKTLYEYVLGLVASGELTNRYDPPATTSHVIVHVGTAGGGWG
jgi:hypothetical protein